MLDANGGGTIAGVLAGLDYILGERFAAPKDEPMIINLSFGGAFSTVLNDAVEACVDAGIPTIVAAGNDRMDACSVSPASAKGVITVAATTKEDTLADFSNQGSCVNILAPGVGIPSASSESAYALRILSGTSMAAPHVTGAVALYLEENPTDTPKQVAKALAKSGAADKISWIYPESGTPNLMLRTKKLI